MSTSSTTAAPLTASAPLPTKRRLGYPVAITAQLLMLAGSSAISPFYSVLAESIGFDAFTLTAIYAIYAAMLLVTLLTLGSISDRVGRRPVIIIGFIALGISMVLIWSASSVGMLLLARALQGAATGLMTSALSASILDFAHPERRASAALWNSVSPSFGLAIGALGAGLSLIVLA